MKAYIFSEFRSLVAKVNDLDLTFIKADESYSNISSLYNSATYYNKVNNRNLKDGVEDCIKSFQMFSEEKNILIDFSIISKEKRSVKYFFLIELANQMCLSYEKTKQLLSKI